MKGCNFKKNLRAPITGRIGWGLATITIGKQKK